jgi:DNA-binding NarL/FixJ family response regulator
MAPHGVPLSSYAITTSGVTPDGHIRGENFPASESKNARMPPRPADPAPPWPGSRPRTTRTIGCGPLCLVAEGRTNRQIAAALFISTNTAGVHVYRILAKWGVATRTETARRLLTATTD